MSEALCDYQLGGWYGDDEPPACELPAGHEGQHMSTLRWTTERGDLCRIEHAGEHQWSEWKPIPRPNATLVSETPTERLYIGPFVSPYLFPPSDGRWTKQPENSRECSRCGDYETDGEWERRPNAAYYFNVKAATSDPS